MDSLLVVGLAHHASIVVEVLITYFPYGKDVVPDGLDHGKNDGSSWNVKVGVKLFYCGCPQIRQLTVIKLVPPKACLGSYGLS